MSEALSLYSGILVLIMALSLDAFAAGIACGSEQIRVPVSSAFLISLTGSVFLTVSLFTGKWMQTQLAAEATGKIGSFCLLLLGIFKLLDYRIKSYINRNRNMRKNIQFSVSRLRFLITIYGNPAVADEDDSRYLSVGEAAAVAAAMSLDSLVAGIGIAAWPVPVWVVVILSALIGAMGVLTGCRLGRRIARSREWDISWLGGVILIGLALMK